MLSSQASISRSLRDAGQGVLAHIADILPFVGTWRTRRVNYYFELAEKSYSEEKLADAILHLKKALKWSAVKGEAYESLGLVYYELGDLDNAKSNLMQALLDNFKHGVTSSLRALRSVGVIFHQEGDLSQAMYYYLKALEVPDGPSDGTVLTNLGAVFCDLGRYEESLKYSRLALAISPDDALTLANIGRASYELGDLEAATENLSLAVGLNPSDGELARLLALCYRTKGNPDQAIATLSAARDTKNPEVFLDLAIAFDAQGRHEEGAQAAFQAAESFKLAGQPDREATAYCQLGWAKYKLDDFPRSIDASRKAVELDPKLFAAQFNLGLVLLLTGDRAGARQHYEAGMNAVREPSEVKFYAIADLEAAVKARGEVSGHQPIMGALEAKQAALTEALSEGPNKAPPVPR